MGWPLMVALWVASFVLTYALMPKPNKPKPPGIGNIDAPTVEEGREIPIVFGTRIVKGINILATCDFGTVALKKKGGKK